MTIQPHDWLDGPSCDTIAECWDGVSTELYQALWGAMDHAKPLSEQIDIEESCPNDAVGLNTTVEFWDKFTDAQKVELNALAEAQAAEYRSWGTELTPEGEQTVIPGCERQTTSKKPQGELF